MSLHQIVLPETKSETEWVRGRALRKMSPTYRHGLLQTRIGAALLAWAEAGNHGRVATEWRFRVTPPAEITRPLVPDVAYLAYTMLPADAHSDDVECPLTAPTIAIDILSPDDRPSDIADKIATYLRSGSRAVLIVDPERTSITVHADGLVQRFGAGAVFTHPTLPGFTIDITNLFARAGS